MSTPTIVVQPSKVCNPPTGLSRPASLYFDGPSETVTIARSGRARVYPVSAWNRHGMGQRLWWNRNKWHFRRIAGGCYLWTAKTPDEIQADERKAEQRRAARQLANSFSRHGWAGHWERR